MEKDLQGAEGAKGAEDLGRVGLGKQSLWHRTTAAEQHFRVRSPWLGDLLVLGPELGSLKACLKAQLSLGFLTFIFAALVQLCMHAVDAVPGCRRLARRLPSCGPAGTSTSSSSRSAGACCSSFFFINVGVFVRILSCLEREGGVSEVASDGSRALRVG